LTNFVPTNMQHKKQITKKVVSREIKLGLVCMRKGSFDQSLLDEKDEHAPLFSENTFECVCFSLNF